MIPALHGIIGSGSGFLIGLNNALCGFSFRRLSDYHTGPVFRVRRASDNAETDIYLNGEYADTTAFAAFIGASQGFMTKFYDQANTNHVSQATAAAQPQVLVASVGSKSLLVSRVVPNKFFFGAVGSPIANPNQAIISTVTANLTGNSNSAICTFGSSGAGLLRSNYMFSNKYYAATGGTLVNTTVAETVNATLTTSFNRNNAVGNTGQLIAYVNAVKMADSASVPMNAISDFSTSIGSFNGSLFFRGDILEVIRADGLWTDAEIIKLQENQKTYYGL